MSASCRTTPISFGLKTDRRLRARRRAFGIAGAGAAHLGHAAAELREDVGLDPRARLRDLPLVPAAPIAAESPAKLAHLIGALVVEGPDAVALDEALELLVEDPVPVEDRRAEARAVLGVQAVGVVHLLCAAGRRDPHLVRREPEILADVLEQRRVGSPGVVADPAGLGDPGEDGHRRAEVPEVRRAQAGEERALPAIRTRFGIWFGEPKVSRLRTPPAMTTSTTRSVLSPGRGMKARTVAPHRPRALASRRGSRGSGRAGTERRSKQRGSSAAIVPSLRHGFSYSALVRMV